MLIHKKEIMRKTVKTERQPGGRRAYICPHCKKIVNFHHSHEWKEVERYNLSDHVADIVQNFNCKKCDEPLQTTIQCGKNGKEYN